MRQRKLAQLELENAERELAEAEKDIAAARHEHAAEKLESETHDYLSAWVGGIALVGLALFVLYQCAGK